MVGRECVRQYRPRILAWIKVAVGQISQLARPQLPREVTHCGALGGREGTIEVNWEELGRIADETGVIPKMCFYL